ncbi:unnamed protein product, partial [marine sediment metagenome]
LVSFLPFPERSWGQNLPYPGKDDEEKIANKAKPDDFSCPAIAIDLGEDIAEDIAQREHEYGGRQNNKTEAYYFYGNYVGGNQAGDEDGGNNYQSV